MKKISIQDLCYIAVFTAVISVVSQFSIPLPGGVPMTLQTFIIPLAGVILGSVNGLWATIIYVLLGAVGIPVFSGWTGGIGIVLGMTGGFIVSFPLIALLAGMGDELGLKYSSSKSTTAKKLSYYGILLVFLLLGNFVNYAVGCVWFIIVAKSSWATALAACVVPFIPTMLLKDALVLVLGPVLKKTLQKAGVLTVRKASLS